MQNGFNFALGGCGGVGGDGDSWIDDIWGGVKTKIGEIDLNKAIDSFFGSDDSSSSPSGSPSGPPSVPGGSEDGSDDSSKEKDTINIMGYEIDKTVAIVAVVVILFFMMKK